MKMPRKQSSKSKSKKPVEPQREQTLKELVQDIQERQEALEKKLDTVISLLQRVNEPRAWNADLASQRAREGTQAWNPYNQPQRREYAQAPTDTSIAQNNPFDTSAASGRAPIDMTDPFDM
jgi:electron transfer flavoprotein alpha/beta subunit